MKKKPAKRRPSKVDRPKRAKRPKVENSGETPAPQAPASAEGMRPQEHGGELRSGNPGNKGGRPRNELREMAMRGYEEGLPALIEMATGRAKITAYTMMGTEYIRSPTPREMKDAMTELGNRGVGKVLEIEMPKTPVSFGFLVSPEVAAERQAQEHAA